LRDFFWRDAPSNLPGLALQVSRSIQKHFITEKLRKPEIAFEHFDMVADADAVDRITCFEDKNALQNFVSDALGSLPPTESEVIRMTVIDQYSITQTSRNLRISPFKVKQMKESGLKKLLGKYGKSRGDHCADSAIVEKHTKRNFVLDGLRAGFCKRFGQ